MTHLNSRDLQKVQNELKFQSYMMMNRHKPNSDSSFGSLIFWVLIIAFLSMYFQ